ncbi:hypothetical protein NEOLEDRAFT_317689 [Neolentinus lepideus HHB14362 ss-1]|uniref:Uncharacterized protein n=1 Tax=Neolentinus lepideus HHB14362 ss-1 TaxID=1314782 RepID=A0A165VU22_9AGAM|nr:hypothetical protein NEOLEDRAFT_317689 [Neolentinus lepideus HHB14362 ss-1]
MPRVEEMVDALPAFRCAASVLDEPLDQAEDQRMLAEVTWLPTREPRPRKMRFDLFHDIDDIDFDAASTVANFEDDEDEQSSLVTPPETFIDPTVATVKSGRDRSVSLVSSVGSVPTTTDAQHPRTSKERFKELVKELSAPFKAYMRDRSAPKSWSIEPCGLMTEEARKREMDRVEAIANSIGCTTRAKTQYWQQLR